MVPPGTQAPFLSQNLPRREALRLASIYLAISALWILASDWLITRLVEDRALHATIASTKGLFFVLTTALLLYILVYRSTSRMREHELQTSHQLETKAEEYRRLFAGNPQPMWVYDVDTLQIIEINDAAIHTYGYSRKEFLARKITDMRPSEEVPRLLQTLKESPDEFRQSHNWRHLKKNGEIIDVEVTSHEVILGQKKTRIVLITDVTERLRTERALADDRLQLEHRVAERTRDILETNNQLQKEIRERKLAEELLRQAHERAEAANQSKSRFIANTTHEIRTPLTSILGYAELLDDLYHGDSRQADYTRIIRQESQHLLDVLDDLLDISRIDAGQLRIELASAPVRDVVQDVVALFRPRAAEKSLDLTLHIADDVPAEIVTDRKRLRQVLTNLVSNAIKYTDSGSINVEVTYTPVPPDHPDQHAHLLFHIKDTGLGLSPDQITQVFEPFFQAHAELRHSGVGLGLSIARSLATMLGGEITVDSEPGKGSTFTFSLPLTTTPPSSIADASHPPSAAPLRGHILLVDDHPNIRQLVATYLENVGAKVTALNNAPEAINLLLGSRDASVDLLLIDMQMPGMDGETAVRKLRHAGYAKPIIALTAHSIAPEQQRWLAAGCNAVATKPIDRATFLPLITSFLPATTDAITPLAETPAPAP